MVTARETRSSRGFRQTLLDRFTNVGVYSRRGNFVIVDMYKIHISEETCRPDPEG